MTYDFSLTRKQTISLIAAFCFLLVLVYAAGLLTGIMIPPKENPSATSPAITGKTPSNPANPSASRLTRPSDITNTVPLTGRARTIVNRPENMIASKKAAIVSKTNQPARIARALSPRQSSGQTAQDYEHTENEKYYPEPGTMPNGITNGQHPVHEPGRVTPPDLRYSVEIESFYVESKALKLLDNLKKKGWDQACILKMSNPADMSRIWYSVQIDDYATWDAAILAASNYKKEEGTVAVINSMHPDLLNERKMCKKK